MAVGTLPQTCAGREPPVAWLRPGQVGYIGPDLGVDLHAASVGVLTVGLDAPFVVETPEYGAIRTRSVYAPARAQHRVIAPEGRILLLFTASSDALELGAAETGSGKGATGPAAMRRHLGPYGLHHRLERELVAACRNGADPGVLRYLAGPALPATADRRIRRVVDQIHDDPSRVLRAEQSAQGLEMSTPYFLRLFARHTGTTFRRYQQWNRLLEATRGIAAGYSLTRCAADAGFASPSHLSDTFHETLGTTATAVLDSHVRFDLDV